MSDLDELERLALEVATPGRWQVCGAHSWPEIETADALAATLERVRVEVTTVEGLDAEFQRADDAGETLTLRDRSGRDWITYGDEWGYRWAWSVPHEDDAFTVPARIDGFEGFERFMPFTVFARAAALGGGDHE